MLYLYLHDASDRLMHEQAGDQVFLIKWPVTA